MWRTLGTGLTLCSLVVGGLLAQDATNSLGEKSRKPAAGRLPANYGKLDLSEKQRDQIYSVQNKYKADLERLQTELNSVRERRDTEVEGVLTAEQRQKLSTLQSEARKKTEGRKSAKSAAETDKSDPAAASTPKPE